MNGNEQSILGEPRVEFDRTAGTLTLVMHLGRDALGAAVAERWRQYFHEAVASDARRCPYIGGLVAARASAVPQRRLDARLRAAKLDRDIAALEAQRAESVGPRDPAAIEAAKAKLAKADACLAAAEAAATGNDVLAAERAAINSAEGILSRRVVELRQRFAADEQRAKAVAAAAAADAWAAWLFVADLAAMAAGAPTRADAAGVVVSAVAALTPRPEPVADDDQDEDDVAALATAARA